MKKVLFLLIGFTPIASAEIDVRVREMPWEQINGEASLIVHAERERYTTLDVDGRFVIAVQTGASDVKPDAVWELRRGKDIVASGESSIASGLLSFDFDLRDLTEGRYDITAKVEGIGEATDFFTIEPLAAPKKSGLIPLQFPRGIPETGGAWPVHFGIPFPKGALTDPGSVRLVGPDGPVVIGTIVRSRWGHGEESSIRWLGVDAQLPGGDGSGYAVEFGGEPGPKLDAVLLLERTGEGVNVRTGPLEFTVASGKLFENVRINGESFPDAAGAHLVDHEGSVYRAANDREITVEVEEQTALRAVLRVEGWFVKDGTDGATQHFQLPTDKLCRFVTRLEVYSGLPVVRVLHTWIITYDSFEVRLRDVAFSLSLPAQTGGTGVPFVEFSQENDRPLEIAMQAGGVRLLQHQPDGFDVEDHDGNILKSGKRSSGIAWTNMGSVGVSLRDTWQRFPKEFEVLPDEFRLHFWPAHGRESHPAIDPYAKDRLHQQWYNHQGSEMDLKVPWEALFAYSKLEKSEALGIYKPVGNIMAGVHSSAMGVAQTHDFLIHFGGVERDRQHRQLLAHQIAPHAIVDPAWLNESKAMGNLHPHDPENFAAAETTLEDLQKGYWEIQNETGQYGMWLYRAWHHNRYLGDGYWGLYRIYSAGHHHEPLMPWLLYARSGDPDYLTMARATSRSFADFMMIHHADPAYAHNEFHFHQKQLVGSTKHTNGHVLWGGDHAVFGHLTTYKALLAAYYLTGDLRFREVLVDEWQKTILEDRPNPEFAKANRIENIGRDNNNSLGELIELYQLTYDPRLLAWIGPGIERMRRDMKVWGLPVERVLQFDGDSVIRRQLLDACRAHRENAGKFDDPHRVFTGHSAAGTFALAHHLAPEENFAAEAFFQLETARKADWARKCRNLEPGAITYCQVPDYVLYVPRVLDAIANSEIGDSITKLVSPQPFPIAPDWSDGGYLRVVVNEAEDREFEVRINGKIGPEGVDVQVIGPDRQLLARKTFPQGAGVQKLTIPTDGQSGAHVVFVRARDNQDHLLVPLTGLPEVYVSSYWAQHSPTRFFTRHANLPDGRLGVRAHKSTTLIYDHTLTTLLVSDEGDETYANLDSVPAEGVWLEFKGRYVHPQDKHSLIISVNPDRYFQPDPAVLEWKPVSD